MKPGVSTACLYPLETEKSLALLCSAGIKNTEVFLNCPSEVEPSFLKELKLVANSFGVNIAAVHPYSSNDETMLFFTNYTRRFNDGVEMYKRYYEAANILGGEIVIFHGMHSHLKMPMEEYAERYGVLHNAARQQGVYLCHENVQRSTSRNPQFFSKLTELMPQAKYVFDIKQAIRSGYEPYDFLSTMGNNIMHIHASDHDKNSDCLPIGKGSFDFNIFVKKLSAIDYKGYVMLELYSDSHNGVKDLVKSYTFLVNMLY